MQLAAEQHTPPEQLLMPPQSSVQALPLQSRPLSHEPVPRQVMVLVPALLCTPSAHDRRPEQVVWQFIPEQLTLPWHESVALHTTVFMLPVAVTPPRQDPLPAHITEQTLPPHWMSPVHALSAQRTVQPVAMWQSMAKLHPDAGQSIRASHAFGTLDRARAGVAGGPAHEQADVVRTRPAPGHTGLAGGGRDRHAAHAARSAAAPAHAAAGAGAAPATWPRRASDAAGSTAASTSHAGITPTAHA